jgi:hypothetical protein
VQSIVTFWKGVTAPKLPLSRQLITPPISVALVAVANVAHGSCMLQGGVACKLLSDPLCDTQVRVATVAPEVDTVTVMAIAATAMLDTNVRMVLVTPL